VSGFAIRAFLTLLVVIDPVGIVPTFVALCGTRPAAEQRWIARRSVTIGGLLLTAFGLGGAWLLSTLGISLDAFRAAGGILLFRIAVGMVFAQRERETEEEAEEAQARADVSVFPLAIPMIAGPGALASVMILAGEARTYSGGLALVLGMAGVVLLLVYAALRLGEGLSRLLGQTGVNVVTRVLGVLLAALAVQYVADGVRVLIRS
jgi:multiple antibiotic resistance protein